jgi:hypothetical protein
MLKWPVWIMVAVAVLMPAGSSAHADLMTVGFPSYASTTFQYYAGFVPLGGSGQADHFKAGDYVAETFSGTGLASVTSSHWVITMSDATAAGVVNTFDVMINGTKIGSYGWTSDNQPVNGFLDQISFRHFDLAFNTPPIAADARDTYTLKIVATSNVPYDDASWNWYPQGKVTLTGAAVAEAPEPTTAALLGIGGIVAIACARWRQRHSYPNGRRRL